MFIRNLSVRSRLPVPGKDIPNLAESLSIDYRFVLSFVLFLIPGDLAKVYRILKQFDDDLLVERLAESNHLAYACLRDPGICGQIIICGVRIVLQIFEEPKTGQDGVGWFLSLMEGSFPVSLCDGLIDRKISGFLAYTEDLFLVIIYVITRD
jgi:hypothetical protein